ncbi:MAG: ABC transporter permease [Planctomycetota bacterium]|jgi:putative ABC transport system permease protein|nr:MAG: ABC transporter permease [Planctomycetota bacterium]RLS99684.1 MAG: ABC transporter permease [Planctomycetota bacterium]
MYRYAIKMLFGDSAKFYGILLGLGFASLLIAQQASIFVGLMSRTFAFVGGVGHIDLWVFDPTQSFVDEPKPLRATALDRVRGVTGVAWAAPIYKGLLVATLPDGRRQVCNVIGIDDDTLAGGPAVIVAGSLSDLRQPDAVMVQVESSQQNMLFPAELAVGAMPAPGQVLDPSLPKRPVQIGDIVELNEHRARVVGLVKCAETFSPGPTVYTVYSRAITYAPPSRRMMSAVLVSAAEGVNPDALAQRIRDETGLESMNPWDYSMRTLGYWMRETGIPINFGIAIALGFFVGVAIAGQMFYNFTLDNLRYFGAFKAMGASSRTLLGMVALQALVAGVLGLGLGLGAVSAFGLNAAGGKLAFKMLWQIPLIAAGAVLIICIFASVVSMWKVLRLDPADVFKGA